MQTETHPELVGYDIADLTGSYNYNGSVDWLNHECPMCESDNVCVLDPKFNGLRVWFCISCRAMWEYCIE